MKKQYEDLQSSYRSSVDILQSRLFDINDILQSQKLESEAQKIFQGEQPSSSDIVNPDSSRADINPVKAIVIHNQDINGTLEKPHHVPVKKKSGNPGEQSRESTTEPESEPRSQQQPKKSNSKKSKNKKKQKVVRT